MAHQWDRGVLASSSWHGLEEVGAFSDANSAITHGDRTGAWPVVLRSDELRTACGLLAPATAIVADYAAHASRILGVVGDRYRATKAEEWRALVTAACAAGAKPTGAFSLCDGSRVLATFEVGVSNGIRTQFLLADAFDGSMRLRAGFTTIRVVCANTLAVSLGQDGSNMAALTHTATMESKVNILREGIADAISTGQKVRETYEQAERIHLTEAAAKTVFSKLFPKADETDSKRAITRAENERCDARKAAAKDINHVGTSRGNLATLWNAATYLVDRNADGTARQRGESDRLNSLLFGSRTKRLQEIQEVIEVVMKDGSIQMMAPREAIDHGCDVRSVGRALLEDMLAG